MVRSLVQNRFRLLVLSIGFALCVTAGWAAPARADAAAAARAQAYLDQQQAGVDVLSFVHYGATYRGHRLIATQAIDGRPADVCLVYQFSWDDDGWTHVHFYCDGNGRVYAIQAGR